MADAPLQRNVVEELLWDPKVDTDSIAVSADDHGKVTLRGTVGSLRQKREAQKGLPHLPHAHRA
jgi:osmotically-inducible protein OsmY